jgi:hypothetical protein
MDSIGLAFLVVLAVAAWLVLRRANQLCVFVVENGKCRLASGRAPPALFGQVDDIVQRSRVGDATLRIVVESGLPRLIADPRVSDAAVQQVRNCVGQYQVAHFRRGRRA